MTNDRTNSDLKRRETKLPRPLLRYVPRETEENLEISSLDSMIYKDLNSKLSEHEQRSVKDFFFKKEGSKLNVT